ncbi:COG3650 family protein [Yunchengibacter salinarum]|uniref:COG3650 family protein n=1 Tax=Yunchengibacter salinarum TaxID=3133399 RepID=UPI0035B61302
MTLRTITGTALLLTTAILAACGGPQGGKTPSRLENTAKTDPTAPSFNARTDAPPQVLRTVRYFCGPEPVDVTYNGDALSLTAPRPDAMAPLTLHRQPSEDGKRYVTNEGSTPEAMVWSKGVRARITRDGVSLSPCREEARTAIWQARGQEPGWALTVSTDKLTLIRDHGADPLTLPKPPVERADGAWHYETASDGIRLTATITPESCTDPMDGTHHDHRVTVTLNENGANSALTGCGGVTTPLNEP